MPRHKRLAPDTDIIAWLLKLPPDLRVDAVNLLGQEERDTLDRDWPGWAHEGQVAPVEDWRTWVIMAGRGFGKTLAGAKWIAEAAATDGRLRVALVGATLEEARRVMVEGRSGLIEVAGANIHSFHPSRRTLRFRSGAEATLFSGASPDALRGPEHHLAWCDELAKWEKPGECWDMLQLGLRLGTMPRALVTTTPRPGPHLRRIMASKGCVVTGGGTHANPHLPEAYVDAVDTLYAGTRLGRQELDGELLTDTPGALWTVELLEQCRIQIPPRNGEGDHAKHGGGGSSASSADIGRSDPSSTDPSTASRSPSPFRGGITYTRTLIAVDPPSGAGTCGIVACALDTANIAHVLADHSVTGRSPEGWAAAVAGAAAAHATTEIVAEANQGGKMVQSVLTAADPSLRIRLVRAEVGKAERAAPVAHRFEAGQVRLHGRFPELEAQLQGMIAGGDYEGPGTSPDRADAMVWGLTALLIEKKAEPRVRFL